MFKHIVSRLSSINLNPLGRWCLKDKSKNNWKIDMANIDHCGTCSYDIKKPPKIKYDKNSSNQIKVSLK